LRCSTCSGRSRPSSSRARPRECTSSPSSSSRCGGHSTTMTSIATHRCRHAAATPYDSCSSCRLSTRASAASGASAQTRDDGQTNLYPVVCATVNVQVLDLHGVAAALVHPGGLQAVLRAGVGRHGGGHGRPPHTRLRRRTLHGQRPSPVLSSDCGCLSSLPLPVTCCGSFCVAPWLRSS
jgi:hypothetical protein